MPQEPGRAECSNKGANGLRKEAEHDVLGVVMVDLSVVEARLVVPCIKTMSSVPETLSEKRDKQVVKPACAEAVQLGARILGDALVEV